MKKVLSAIFVLSFMLVSFSACGNSGSSSVTSAAGSAAKSAKTLSVAYITPSIQLPYWRYVQDGIQQEIKSSGVTVKYQAYDSNNDAATQLKNAQDAIAKGVSAIIISPTDSSSCGAVLSAASDAKVPTVICDIGTDSGDYNSFVISNNAAGAGAIAKSLVAYLKNKGITSGKYADITISLARQNGKDRTNGFDTVMKAAGFTAVDTKQMEKVNREEGESLTQDVITSHPDLTALFVESDEPALGAITAIKNANRNVIVAGFDGTEETIAAIKSGELFGTAIQQPVLMGAKSMQAVIDISQGKSVEKIQKLDILNVTQDGLSSMMAQISKNCLPADDSGSSNS